jgi:hypothetical protein
MHRRSEQDPERNKPCMYACVLTQTLVGATGEHQRRHARHDQADTDHEPLTHHDPSVSTEVSPGVATSLWCGAPLRASVCPLRRGRGPDHFVRPCRRHLPAAGQDSGPSPSCATRATVDYHSFAVVDVPCKGNYCPWAAPARMASAHHGAAIRSVLGRQGAAEPG